MKISDPLCGVIIVVPCMAGEEEVSSEDALQLGITKGQEEFVELLKSQPTGVAGLQQKFTEQRQVRMSHLQVSAES